MKVLDKLPYKVVKIRLVMSTKGNIWSSCVFTFNLGAELCADFFGGCQRASLFFLPLFWGAVLWDLTHGFGHAKNQLLLTYTGTFS